MQDKIQEAINICQKYEPQDGYYLGYSGGKDSIVLLDIAKKSGVKFQAHYNHTTIDHPEIVKEIHKNPEIIIDYPQESFWKLILRKRTMPLRTARFCCEILKEQGGENRIKLLGMRKAESAKRSNYKEWEYCPTRGIMNALPLLNWTEKDVWNYIKSNNLPYPKLYDEGYDRIGCILCPCSKSKSKIEDIRRYPKFIKTLFICMDKMIKAYFERKALGLQKKTNKLKKHCSSALEYFKFYIDYSRMSKVNKVIVDELLIQYGFMDEKSINRQLKF